MWPSLVACLPCFFFFFNCPCPFCLGFSGPCSSVSIVTALLLLPSSNILYTLSRASRFDVPFSSSFPFVCVFGSAFLLLPVLESKPAAASC